MTPYRKRQTEATRRMAEDMTIRNFAVRTIDSYTYHVDRFSKHFGKMPEDLGPEQVREFQLWMRNCGTATERSHASESQTHRLIAHATESRSGQGRQGSLCAALSETLDRTENLLGQLQADGLPLSRQDPGHSTQPEHEVLCPQCAVADIKSVMRLVDMQ